MNPVISTIAIGSLAVVCAALLAGLCMLRVRLNRMRRTLAVLHCPGDGEDFATIVARHVGATRTLDAHLCALESRVDEMRRALAGAVQRVGVVRFDAFADMGGRLSFAAALLDESGSGIVLTCINSRADARMYSKGISAGLAEEELSHEEMAAIRLAIAPESVEVG